MTAQEFGHFHRMLCGSFGLLAIKILNESKASDTEEAGEESNDILFHEQLSMDLFLNVS